jgi:prefoldin subunit 5
MRKYIESINQGIENLAQDERDCMKELDRITQEKKRLLDQLDTANAQMVGILNERLGR